MEEGEGALELLLTRFGLNFAKPGGALCHDFTHRRLNIPVYKARREASEYPGTARYRS